MGSSCSRNCHLFGLLVIVCWVPRAIAYAAPEKTPPVDIVMGMVARAEAVVSGRFHYRQDSGFRSSGTVLSSGEMQFSLMGRSWAVRFPDSGLTRVSHKGKYLVFDPERQRDGREFPAAQVFHDRPITNEQPPPPYFAGTLWYREQVAFVKANAARARAAQRAAVDGVNCVALDWDVDSSEIGSAFVVIDEQLARGGTLRVHVAPELGYAVPKIEYFDKRNHLAAIYSSKDFEQVTAGLYMPRYCDHQNIKADGSVAYYVEYRFTRFEKINEPIPESDFVLFLPRGTRVNDSRVADGYFVVGEIDSVPGAIADIVEFERPAGRPGRWLRVAIILANVFVIGLLFLVWLKRRGGIGRLLKRAR